MAHPTRSGANGQHPGETGRSWHRMTVLTEVSSPETLSVVPARERKVKFHVVPLF